MTSVVPEEKEQRLSFWKKHIDLALSSGVSTKKYCELNNLKQSTLQGYKKKIYPELYTSRKPRQKLASIKPSGFKKIEVRPVVEKMHFDQSSPEWVARFLKEFLN